MDTASPDPLDAIWPPEQRAAARERCRLNGRQVGLDQLASVPASMADEAFRQDYADTIGENWARAHDEFQHRVGEILRAPEAVGREPLARQLAFQTKHSALAAILILRSAGTDVATLPVGGERRERLAAMRRVATMEASA
ncbi:hypothetical protein [Methylobacterium sp. E-046]|uniref:hypothetical protein n=1 Tax=Methylobacterium sp. E-046 TaxID=2836576 RepID=UPI001FBACFB8|nr:hypothetical protein [Methylobacterium sp. E-046]MCJ2102709.1 hypothetical protein [Methylobacterium sp. E-046]